MPSTPSSCFYNSLVSPYIPSLPPHLHNMDHPSKNVFKKIYLSLNLQLLFLTANWPSVPVSLLSPPNPVLNIHVYFLKLAHHTFYLPIIVIATLSASNPDSLLPFILCIYSPDPMDFTLPQYLQPVDPLLLLASLALWCSSLLLEQL